MNEHVGLTLTTAQVEANENERQILARFTHVESIPAPRPAQMLLKEM